MPTIEFTDDQYERFRAIRADLEAVYVGEYGTVNEQDALDYLLDTYTPPGELDAGADGTARGDSTPDGAETTDETVSEEPLTAVPCIGKTEATALSSAGFETVPDLRAATPDALATADGIGEELAAEIAVALDTGVLDGPTDGGAGSDAGGRDAAERDGGTDGGSHDDGAARLESMMSLLDDHEAVWRESGGDEPYEVDLPDGSVETARTKDHVRQLLFQHYR